MKILMALMGLEIGGAETHVVELSRGLTAMGHTVIIASNGGAYEKTLEDCGIRHYSVPMHRREPGLMAASLKRLRSIIREERPDLVHAHARIPAMLCGMLHKTMHFPFITSAHWVFEVTPLLRLMTNWGQYTVAVSQDIKTYLMENYHLPADQISVTINGIDTEGFAPGQDFPGLRQELNLGSGPIVGLVSRLDESRSLAAEKLIAIAESLAKEIPETQILIVGGGDREAVLRQQAAEINQRAGRNLIVMTGPRTDVAKLVSLCDVFVGASRAALEAMAAAKPVILAGNEGYMGIFEESKLPGCQQTNFCYRGETMVTEDAMLADTLALLKMSPEEQSTLGAYGRDVVMAYYSVRRMTQDYLDAYETLLHPEKRLHAVISGYYGYNNLGDDAILKAAGKQLSALNRPVSLTVLSNNPEETAAQYGLRAIPRFRALQVWRAIRKCDVLISGGGSLIQDRTSTRSLLYYLSVIRMAQLLKKPTFIYANGVGPISGEANRRRTAKVLKKCSCITLRDADSQRELRALGITNTHLTADPAFLLEPDGNAGAVLTGIPRERGMVGVSVRNTAGMQTAVDAFAELCDRISRELGKTVVLIVMQGPGDRRLCETLKNRMQEPAYLLETPNAPEKMLAAIGEMEALISMRLHTIIFAARQRVPVVGCVYDPKVSAFLDMLKMPSCGTPEDMNAEETFARLQELLTHAEAHRERLNAIVTELEQLAAENGRLFEEMMK